ncbi:RNA polymerase sigma-54 factor RpoN [hydrothermal vent metagenome]|uniref:RNA polymerase sigma-54 factor RpoN n=1 Tax=hydrothermal vent metagenome TaxID=652676 RepID=A0A1W1B902_9ZZZZ
MATLRQDSSVVTKHKLSNTLRNWLPILHSSLNDLQEIIKPFVESNPVIEIESAFEKPMSQTISKRVIYGNITTTQSQKLEALTIQQKSLYDLLDEQIDSHLFPTPLSKEIAYFVIENLDEFGYYEGDTDAFCKDKGIKVEDFERIRRRFIYIDPAGIGAKDLRESFLFQLENSDISDEAYDLALKMIEDLENIYSYDKEPYFSEAMRVISRFYNPPNIEYEQKSEEIIPDIMIYFDEDGNIEVKLNDEYYPIIHIESEYAVEHEFISKKLKEAKSLVDALDMRRATLYKVGLMIVEYQYDFFAGGSIKPLTLKTLADEFGHNPSTISRAIANKYIACDRGIFPMKEFFTTAIDEETSNATIKEYVKELIKNEPRQKPLSDMKILELVQEKFHVKMVRRTIAKYRKQLNIAGSSERKKLYKLET